MKSLVKPSSPLTRVAVILLLLALLPALLYTGYELSSLSTTEQLLSEVYTRQLDAVLFSVNQYAWDVSNSWAGSVELLVREGRQPADVDSTLRQFLRRNAAVLGIATAESTGIIRQLVLQKGGDVQLKSQLQEALRANGAVLERLVRYRRSEYRKLESLLLEPSRNVVLVFATGIEAGGPSIAGLVLDGDGFVRGVIGRKLLEVGGEGFVLAVLSTKTDSALFATAEVKPEALQLKKNLWLFADQQLGIRLKGATVQEIVEARAQRNILLIIVLALVLLAGAWFVYRTIRREMDLVRMKSDFVSNVSHELRTPLALIRMFGETLEMGRIKDDDKRQEYYSTIVKESERLSRLVNNILDFAKMEAGKKHYSFRPVDLNAVVSSVMNTYSYHLHSNGFEPHINLQPDLPAITADTEAVTEAVINLVDNAMKYSNEKKYVRVCTATRDQSVVVEIEDHGIGISKGDQQKIFETFYRVSTGLVHNTKGSGLGLTLVKHIMQAHHGSVEVESAPGKGSVFRLLFPITTTT